MDEAGSKARAERDLAAIKSREAQAKAAIERGDPEVSVGAFGMSQLGLGLAMVDRWGRIWRDSEDGKLVLVYPPAARTVPTDIHGQPVTMEQMDSAMGYKGGKGF